MKKIIILSIAAVFMLAFSSRLSAQSHKFGYINTMELMKVVPEVDSAQKKIQAFAKELELQIEEIQVELNRKKDAYSKAEATLNDEAKAARKKEINDMTRRVNDQMQDAEKRYGEESQKIMEPVREKIRAVIAKVGKDNGYTYIFDTAGDTIPFMNLAQSTDVMDMVKKELKITK